MKEEIKRGTLIRCNDQRYGWTVPILDIISVPGTDAYVVIQPRTAGRVVKVRLDRIFNDGKTRAQGYNVVELAEVEFSRATRKPEEHELHRHDDDGHGGAIGARYPKDIW